MPLSIQRRTENDVELVSLQRRLVYGNEIRILSEITRLLLFKENEKDCTDLHCRLAIRAARQWSNFRKFLTTVGLLPMNRSALRLLQLGRAYGMAGDSAKARAAYQDFLTLWKDADPDVPILKRAKAKYARLQ